MCSAFHIPCCCFAAYPALQLVGHGATDFDHTTVTTCHIPELHEDRRTEVRTNGIYQSFTDPGKRRDHVVELGLSKHRIEADHA